MKSYGRSRHARCDKWASRMAIIGITPVVMCLTVAINIKGADLKQSGLDYKVREENLDAQVKAEGKRAEESKEHKIYVKTKRHAEEVAKEELGLVNPGEILLKSMEQ